MRSLRPALRPRFVVGLTSTVEGGPAIDLAYHLTGLPLLIVILILLVRTPATPG